MPRDEDRILILGRKHGPGVEAHPERRSMRPKQGSWLDEVITRLAPPELRIGKIALMTVGIAEVLPYLRRAIQLIVGQILREPVALVVGEPQLAGLRMKVKAHRVTHATRHDLRATAVEVDPADVRVLFGVRLADVAWRSHRHIELAIGADLDELPAVWDVAGELIVDRDRRGRAVELVLDVVVAGDRLRGRDVERALVELDAVRQLELLRDRLDLACAALVHDCVDLAGAEEGADEDRAAVALPQPASIEDVGRVDLDLEAWRNLHLRDGQLVGRGWNRERRHRRHRGARTSRGAADCPERHVLLLRWLLLCVGRPCTNGEGGADGDQSDDPPHLRDWHHEVILLWSCGLSPRAG